MMTWERWRVEEREVTDVQTESVQVERFLLPFAADDEQRDDMFDRLMDVINEVTTTEDRVMVESTSDWIVIKRMV